MSMVCPQCKLDFDKQTNCPTCGCRLLYHLSTFSTPTGPMIEDNWQQTSWGRIIVGLVLAQGLGYGAQHLCMAGILASDDANRSVWAGFFGLALLHALQGLSLLIGAAVSGAGQRRGTLYGSLIGLAHGLVFLVQQKQDTDNLMALYGQPVLFTLLGGVGGRLGMLIWKPIPILPIGGATEKVKFNWGLLSISHYFAGPVHIMRVLAGSIIVVLGVLWANTILHFIIEFSAGALTTSSHLEDRLLLVEVTALATLVGSACAGANTFNGLKQGLFVGILAGITLIGVQFQSQRGGGETMALTMASTMTLTLTGGWFGGQLFPPILNRRRRFSNIPY